MTEIINLTPEQIAMKPKQYKYYFGVKDKDFGFTEIFPVDNAALAIRGFANAVGNDDKNNNLRRNAECFSLWSVFKMDVETGEVTNDLRKIVEASDYVNHE